MEKKIAFRTERIGIIILAAGASRRMGKPKQLLKIDNQTLIERGIAITQALAHQETVVVLGAHAESIIPFIVAKPSLNFIINEKWGQGMGTTLKVGLEFLLNRAKDLSAVIVMVCDQPYLSTEKLQELIDKHQETKADIVTTSYNNIKGVPALFSKDLFDRLLSLDKDEGARKIIKRYEGKIEVVDFPKGIYDLDTPQAYQAYLERTTNEKG